MKFILKIASKYLIQAAEIYVSKTTNKYDDQAVKFLKDLLKNL